MTTYHLAPPAAAPTAPTLDEHQRRVVEHGAGPLLVLAGPGTGKTTTLVEAIVDRIERRGASPDEVLALTFSRKAAEQLRDRVTGRLGRTMTANPCSTFHSFAYQLVRRYAPAELYDAPLRLLSAPEADVVLRELLAENPESVRWPESFRHALGTRGFAREVASVLSRAREKGLEGSALHELGLTEGVPEFAAAGLFLDQYLTILDAQGAIDYPDLIRRATIEAEAHQADLRARYRWIFVDEFQDTDPGQIALLQALAGDGGNLVAVGDPHQSIYGFRGAEVRGILEFPTTFPTASGDPAPVVALRTTRRFGLRVLTAAQRVAGRIGLPGTIDSDAREAFLAPEAAGPDGRVQVLTFDSERAEAEHVADLLRRAHLEDGIDWDEMAVLVRSGRSSIPPLRRALGALGVPVEVAGDEVPLVRDPAVEPLLEALRAALNLDNDDPLRGGYLDPSRIEALLTGPLGGLAAGDVRRLARALRTRERRPSRELLRAAVVDPSFLAGVTGAAAADVAKASALVSLLHRVRVLADDGAGPEELLWELWSATSWPERLRRSVDLGGAAARRAHRDLDAIVALFETAARVQEARDHTDARVFLETLGAQQIPADTLAERGARGAAVRLLTAHRSKGLEWRLVVVAHVQAEAWPDLRRRSSLLQPDRIGPAGEGLIPSLSPRELLAEERRLFYVACTRARERLIVTAVHSNDDEGEQPSRFLEELGVPPTRIIGRPKRPLSLGGLVAELRRVAASPDSPPALRDAAARRLARLASETRGDRALVPAADPSTWWGTRSATRAVSPLRDPDGPVPISPSALDRLVQCPMEWFLSREAGGVAASHQAANVGELVHALAQRVASKELPPDIEVLMSHVDAVWERLQFRTSWSGVREHARIRAALERFLAWHGSNPRTVIGLESSFRADVSVTHEDGGDLVRVSGRLDRLELDHEGNVVVVDLKTGKNVPTGPAVLRHRQLGLYQLAVDRGGVAELAPGAGSGGAELVQLGSPDLSAPVKVQAQPVHADDSEERLALQIELGIAARRVRREEFPAIQGDHCRTCTFLSLCPARGAAAVTA
ncbi:ATP-dependent helicase [Nocardioides sp. Kera G14]|uniref:ATP-dependent helicase n=1 Tax=Nocardioides sp. Kera G14 TaxID=2884264 RepID=UPI001D0F67D5|nr:ATP-dependent DNA helicase [Nocardioides sp. Kera G14]UDY24569.1 ATP-dependent helicase [Nocardioides sp. Kera G14]